MSQQDDLQNASGMPPSAILMQMIRGAVVSQAIYVAAKLGIADLLNDGPKRSDELAQITATHAPSLYRVLRLLAALGVFAEIEKGRFGLTPLSECLQTRVPGSVRAWALMTETSGGLAPLHPLQREDWRASVRPPLRDGTVPIPSAAPERRCRLSMLR